MTRLQVKPPLQSMPKFIEPSLARLASAPPDGSQWVHEIKFDGYRMEARIDAGGVELLTRTGLDWTARFKALAKAFDGMSVKEAIIDGEAVVLDAHGASNFVLLVEALKAGKSASIVYYAFDLLYLNGHSLLSLPLSERKALLRAMLRPLPDNGAIRFSEHFAGNGAALLASACKLGLEGVVSKRIDKPYRPGRRDDWIKCKCVQSDEFVIAGYVDSAATAKSVGALLVGYHSNGKLIYAGRVGTGFTQARAKDLWKELQGLRTEDEPFEKRLSALQRRDVAWVKPKLVAEVEYRTWTADGLLRQAAFKALRADKRARDVQKPA